MDNDYMTTIRTLIFQKYWGARLQVNVDFLFHIFMHLAWGKD